MPFSSWITSPTSVQGRQLFSTLVRRDQLSDAAMMTISATTSTTSESFNLGHLTLLVFEAVLEVVCVVAPGYVIARLGMFDAESQKFLANLNVMIFTPCLIFTKLASQLTAEKLVELAIIPVIFIVQTLVSYSCALVLGKCLRFKKRQRNFLIAMGVFGNSNSLPISLVISLSATMKGLHWDKIPHDNDNEVAARGILYLLIFQQLGQLVRWSWGYNVLLAPPETYTEEEGGSKRIHNLERGRSQERGDAHETRNLLDISPDDTERDLSDEFDDEQTRFGDSPNTRSTGFKTPITTGTNSGESSRSESQDGPLARKRPNLPSGYTNGHTTFANHAGAGFPDTPAEDDDENNQGIRGRINHHIHQHQIKFYETRDLLRERFNALYGRIPPSIQHGLSTVGKFIGRFFSGLWEFMNPPLWAMLLAIIVASVPALQHLFFTKGSFIRNSVTNAVVQSGGVAVPLILVVLGGNLARNTLPNDEQNQIGDPAEERKLLIASLVSRMVLPTVIMAPILALIAKYVPVSIVDDKIFVIVCFLLTGAPTALQLAQICQINNVYMPVMARILFQSYVVWILPSTLILVLLALLSVQWATS